MKKSFKKAGAAVLSMAMLLSMGAMSMPVYAAPTAMNEHAGEQRPGTVTVHITGLDSDAYHQGEGSGMFDTQNGEGPDTDAKAKYEAANSGTYTEKYKYLTLNGANSLDFLKNIEEANVTMYQVATLTNDNGWDWVQYIKDQGTSIPGFTGFDNLLKNKDGVEDDTLKSSVTGDYEFNTSSKDLQKMASYLERVVTDLETSVAEKKAAYEADTSNVTKENAYKAEQAKLDAIKVGEGKIDQSNKTTGVTIPVITPRILDEDGNGDGVFDHDEEVLTQNKIGYYLIVTKTDQAGTIVQPVLVSLKNNEDKNVSVKGSTIQFEKSMTAIYSTDEEGYKSSDRFVSTEESTLIDAQSAANLKNGLVAKDDIVEYEIVSQLPEYDPILKGYNITDFVIHDTASKGITILAPTVDGEPTKIDSDEFEVYLATDKDDLLDPAKRWKLTGSTSKNVGDYELSLAEGGHGFDLIISGYQMIQEDTRTKYQNGTVVAGEDGVVDTVPMVNDNSSDASLTGQTLAWASRFDTTDEMDEDNTVVRVAQNKSGASNMYNMYILVKFKAAVNRDEDGAVTEDEEDLAFNRKFHKYAEVADVDEEMLNAVGETDLADDAAGYGDAKKADALKQILRAQLFNGETRYNMTYSPSDYASSNEDFAALTGDTLDDLTDALEATGLFEDVHTNWNVGTAPEDEMCRILVLLARDKHNIELNGDYNTAHLTYGNQYATGKNEVKMTTNYSKVYSVGLKLDKFIETLEIEGVLTVPETYDAYSAFWNNIKGEEITIEYTTGADTPGTWTGKPEDLTDDTDTDAIALATSNELDGKTVASDISGAPAEGNIFGSTGTVLTATQKAVLAYLIDKQNDDIGEDGKYIVSNTNGKEPVIGAIFHLSRIASNNEPTQPTVVVKDYGYAVSNAAGKLIKLDVTKYDTENEANAVADQTGKRKFVFEDDGKWYVGFALEDATDGFVGDNTWDMLDIGYYEIEEVQVPTGFKKWKTARFQIEAEKDTAGADLAAGSWTGAYSAKGLNIDKKTLSTSNGLASIQERADGKVDFMYYNVSEDGDYTDVANYSDGYLYHELYNEYLDQLPATGGMGTVLFTAGGISVVLIAGALFVMYMKKRNNEEEE